ncbi:unnamed protein product [Durusdinium trenchii]|uniref:Uncharacterized protein n=1 Tax=Durusdinium trenchii TaxID=1381693 RepID=A0ABP0IQJ5_9DINO
MNQRSIETQRDWETDISHNGRKTSLLHAGLARRPEGLEGRLLAGHQFNKTGSHDHDQHQQQLVATNENDIEINNIINNVQTDTHTHANCGADFDDRSSRTSQLGTDSGEESTHRSQMNSLDSEYEAEGMPEDDEGKGKPSSSETKTDVFNGDADVADADYSFKRRRLC